MEVNSTTTRDCPGLEVLDFRPNYPCFNETDTRQCEDEWPCEVREYWIQLHPFVDVTRGFLSYGTLVIISLGVFLNSLSFYVLLSSGLAKNGSGIYLLTLAVCDSGNLLVNYAVGLWRGHSNSFNQYFMDYEWLCRFHAVFVELFQTISAWIVVSFTVERCLAVWYPMLFRHNRKHRSKIVVASLTSVLSCFCLSKLFLSGFEKDSVFGYGPCNSKRWIWQGMAYLRVAFQTWIPTIIVFVFNCLMFYKLREVKMNRKKLTELREKTREIAGGPRRSQSFINKPSPTNPMLIAVSVAYLVMVFPIGAVQTVELYWNVHREVPVTTSGPLRDEYVYWKTKKLLIKYIRAFCFGLYQINFGVNFFLYFAAGLEFRVHLQKEVRRVVGKIRRSFGCGGTTRGLRDDNSDGRSHSMVTSTISVPGSSVGSIASAIE